MSIEGTLEDAEPFVEILGCTRRAETRSYRLRVVPGGVELWRVTESDLGGLQSVKESDFQEFRAGDGLPR